MNNYIDRTIINIITLLISGAGIFSAMTKFNVPELSKSFWNENPFAIKRDKIDVVMSWIFTFLTLLGLIIQAVTIISGHNIPDRNYGAIIYFAVFCFGLLIMYIVVILLTKLGYLIARRRWLPKIIANQKELYENASFIIKNKGLSINRFGQEDSNKHDAKYIQKNLEKADEYFTQIENLLELPNDKVDLMVRLDRLRSFFE